jgi:hypothetical protein
MGTQLDVEFIQTDHFRHLDPLSMLSSLPSGERSKFYAIVTAVRSAPLGSFSGGGYREAMHGEMRGLFEIRYRGKRPWLNRFFCSVNGELRQITILAGVRKKDGEAISPRTYAEIRALADELTS